MVQRKNNLFDIANGIGKLSEEAMQANLEGKSLARSKNQLRRGFQWGQYTEDARALLRLINIATGREADLQGAHFHVWDAEQTADIVSKLRRFVLGMEQALDKPKGEPKHREQMHKELYKAAEAEVSRIWNETGVDYHNWESAWESCPTPFASCPKSLKAIQSDTPKK